MARKNNYVPPEKFSPTVPYDTSFVHAGNFDRFMDPVVMDAIERQDIGRLTSMAEAYRRNAEILADRHNEALIEKARKAGVIACKEEKVEPNYILAATVFAIIYLIHQSSMLLHKATEAGAFKSPTGSKYGSDQKYGTPHKIRFASGEGRIE